jgi:tetratricopeptide (TPR) repeat protein
MLLIAGAALLGSLGSDKAARADDSDAALRKRALALNDVTGDLPIKGEIKDLVEDPAGTKKLLAVAVRMAKEKEQPFNYNGAYILARASLILKDYDASKVLFHVCAEEASKLQSTKKLQEAFFGTLTVIDQLFRNKKFDESTKLAQEFLETLEKKGVRKEFQAEVLRRMSRSLAKEGKLDQANRIADNLISARDKDYLNHQLKGWLLNEAKKYDEAIKSFQKALQRLEDDERLEKEQKQEILSELRREIVQTFAKEGKFDEAGKMVEELIKGHENDWRKLELKAWFNKERKHYDEVAKTYGKILELIEKDDSIPQEQKGELILEIQRQRLQALARVGKFAEADAIYKSILKGKEDSWRVLELGAFVEQEKGKFDEAAKTYLNMMKLVAQDKSLQEDERAKLQDTVRYILSGVYVDADQVEKAAEQLKILLAKEPDSPRYNNDLGYIWADHDMNIPEAERMIRKALDEDRKQRKLKGPSESEDDDDNAAYLDSMGWVLFKQKKYEEAKKFLLEAVKRKEGQHIEILDHLADVYMAQGEKGKAIEVWKNALKLDTATFRERQKHLEVEKKLKATEQSAARPKQAATPR